MIKKHEFLNNVAFFEMRPKMVVLIDMINILSIRQSVIIVNKIQKNWSLSTINLPFS